MSTNIATLSAKVTANASGFVAGMETAKKSAATLNTALVQQVNISNRTTYAVQQLAFGMQDAATVFGTSGFSGAVRAASNNVIQFASLISPMAGTLAALAGTGIALTVDYFAKMAKEAATSEKAVDRVGEALKQLQKETSGLLNVSQFLDKSRRATESISELDTPKEIEKRREQMKAELADLKRAAVAAGRAEMKINDKLQNGVDVPHSDKYAAARGEMEKAAVTGKHREELIQELDKAREEQQRIASEIARIQGVKKAGVKQSNFGLFGELSQQEAEVKNREEQKALEDRLKAQQDFFDRSIEAEKQYAKEKADYEKKIQREADIEARAKEHDEKRLLMELKHLQGTGHSVLAGAAEFGSAQASASIGAAMADKTGMTEAERAIIEQLRLLHKTEERVEKAISDFPKVTVQNIA